MADVDIDRVWQLAARFIFAHAHAGQFHVVCGVHDAERSSILVRSADEALSAVENQHGVWGLDDQEDLHRGFWIKITCTNDEEIQIPTGYLT